MFPCDSSVPGVGVRVDRTGVKVKFTVGRRSETCSFWEGGETRIGPCKQGQIKSFETNTEHFHFCSHQSGDEGGLKFL